MKRVAIIIFLFLLFSSCGVNSVGENQFPYPSLDGNTVKSYTVFESAGANDEFNIAMDENPIDKKMKEELYAKDASAREQQVFYDGFAQLWADELEFSLKNLKAYLTEKEKGALSEAQDLWLQSVEKNNQLDLELIGSNQISLGTQFSASALCYLIEQYKDRVFHIKYMTYLIENYSEQAIDEKQQTWSDFNLSN